MDVDVENLTDAELRSKLLEFGFPVMPITGTTRKIMMKKLKMLLENKNKANKESRRSLGRYSSEDESDSDSKSKKDRSRRATMAAPPMQPPRRRTGKIEVSVDASPLKREVKTTTTTTKTTKILQSAKDEFDTGSESDEVAEKYDNVSYRRESPAGDGYRKESLLDDDYRRDSPVLGDGFKKTPSPGRFSTSMSRLPSSFVSASLAADAASDRLSQIRSRHSTYSSGYDKSYYTSPTEDLLKDKENTPFLSNYTKRLSQLSASPKSPVYDYKSDIIKENDVNGGTATSRAYLSSLRASRGRPSTYDFKLNHSIFKNNNLVLVVALLFFVILGVVYLAIRSDTAQEVTAKIPICVETDVNLRRYVNCILESERKPTLDLLQVLKPELNRRALRNKCEDGKAKPYMTESDVVNFIVTNYMIKDDQRILTDLGNLEVLSFFNSAWGINILQLPEDNVSFTEEAIATDMDQVIEGKRTKITALIARHPYIPWKCYFYNTIWAFFSVLCSVLVGILIIFALNYVFKLYKQLRQKQQDEEITIVEKIIDILQSNASESEDNYMVINHIRDMILPINERKSKQKLWARSVKYIHENESRIRTEERVVQGEISEVWRWLGGPSLNTSKNKSWQGQAFETEVGSVNSLPCSPTPCLKIRGMVEEGDRNTLMIKKAVLSKCAQQCRILHCAVDLNSKCVYLKCADPSDAAVAYRNLHGWWYAGNLVTVKYLRLERYMQRFPDSPVSGPPFLQ